MESPSLRASRAALRAALSAAAEKSVAAMIFMILTSEQRSCRADDTVARLPVGRTASTLCVSSRGRTQELRVPRVTRRAFIAAAPGAGAPRGGHGREHPDDPIGASSCARWAAGRAACSIGFRGSASDDKSGAGGGGWIWWLTPGGGARAQPGADLPRPVDRGARGGA